MNKHTTLGVTEEMPTQHLCLGLLALLLHCSGAFANAELWEFARVQDWPAFEDCLSRTPLDALNINYAPNTDYPSVLSLIPKERRRAYYLSPTLGLRLLQLKPQDPDPHLARFLQAVGIFRVLLEQGERGFVIRTILSTDFLQRQNERERSSLIRLLIPGVSIL